MWSWIHNLGPERQKEEENYHKDGVTAEEIRKYMEGKSYEQ